MHRYSFWAVFADQTYISTLSSCPNMVFITELHKPGHLKVAISSFYIQSKAYFGTIIREIQFSPQHFYRLMKFYPQIDRVMVSAAMYCRRNLGRFSVFSVQKTKIFHLHWHKRKEKQQLHIWEAETRLYLAFILDKSQQLTTNLMLLTNSLSVWQFQR